jgi:hypothetical protein
MYGWVWYVFRFGKSFQLVIIIRSNQTLHHAGKIQTFIIHTCHSIIVCVCVCVCVCVTDRLDMQLSQVCETFPLISLFAQSSTMVFQSSVFGDKQ